MSERYVIHVTKACNCACLYCYEQDKSSIYTWEEIKVFLDNIVAFNQDKTFSIEFLGGEPCLAFDLIRQSHNYLEAIPGIFVEHYGITTNGTIVNPEIINFLKANPKTTFSISMDGTKFMNQLRIFKDSTKNTYDTVVENLKILIKEIGDNRVYVHIVTHPYNIGYLSMGIDHLYQLGVRGVGIGTVESTMQLTDEYCDKFISELRLVSDQMHKGTYPYLTIDLFNHLKPKSDQKSYIKDDTGKVIGESYGRTKDDVTKKDIYNVHIGTSSVSDLIYNLRERVYNYHNLKR